MSDQLEDVYLSSYSFHICDITYSAFLQYFDRDAFLGKLVQTFTNFTKSAFANLFFDKVVADDPSFLCLFDNGVFIIVLLFLL